MGGGGRGLIWISQALSQFGVGQPGGLRICVVGKKSLGTDIQCKR